MEKEIILYKHKFILNPLTLYLGGGTPSLLSPEQLFKLKSILETHLEFSTSLEFTIEVNPKTNKIEWEYKDNPPTEFYSGIGSSVQRLPNGNTLINEFDLGRVFEVTYDGELVWEYVSPFYTGKVRSKLKGAELGRNNCMHYIRRYGTNFEGFKGKDLDPNNYKVLNQIYGPDAFKKS